jgi:hypothetical protein
MSGVPIDLQLTETVPVASTPNVPWQGHPDHLVSTSNFTEPIKTSLLDPNVANEDDSCTVAASPYNCDTTLLEPQSQVNEARQLTMTRSGWNDMDFGICLECKAD